MTVGELLRELLDGAVDQAGRLGIAVDQELVELLLADLLGRRVAERILADRFARRSRQSSRIARKARLLARSPTKPSPSRSSAL